MNRERRLRVLEEAQPSAAPRWHCLRRYEDESEADAIAAYEVENGPIGDGNVIMRVVISKPGKDQLVANASDDPSEAVDGNEQSARDAKSHPNRHVLTIVETRSGSQIYKQPEARP